MPRGDRTGPAGLGPMTGRGASFSAGYPVAGFMNPEWASGGGAPGWGRGGRGGGWRRRHGFLASGISSWQRAWPTSPPPAMAAYAPFMSKEQEVEVLRNQARCFEQALEDLRNRIREVESKADGS
jgi:hypothetical protein